MQRRLTNGSLKRSPSPSCLHKKCHSLDFFFRLWITWRLWNPWFKERKVILPSLFLNTIKRLSIEVEIWFVNQGQKKKKTAFLLRQDDTSTINSLFAEFGKCVDLKIKSLNYEFRGSIYFPTAINSAAMTAHLMILLGLRWGCNYASGIFPTQEGIVVVRYSRFKLALFN